MGKNIAIFCDGTGNQFGDRNSNVVKLFAVARRSGNSQVSYYDPGVGTFGLSEALFEWQKVPANKVMGLAFGWGITRNIEQAYAFLMRHYAPNDRVYLFGFSRGAYTARALAGMIRAVGLLHPQHENLIEYATRLYQNVPEEGGASAEFFELQGRFRNQFSRDCPIRFMGLWDTVKSIGWFGSPVKLPYTASNPKVACVRHAVSLDERRCFFRQNLWHPSDGQDVKQVWFAGVHSDVGGGYPEPESALAKLPLEWMAREARQHEFDIEPDELARVLGRLPSGDDEVAPWPLGKIHRSLHGPWWLAEILPRRFEDPRQAFRPVWRWPLLQWRELKRRAMCVPSLRWCTDRLSRAWVPAWATPRRTCRPACRSKTRNCRAPRRRRQARVEMTLREGT